MIIYKCTECSVERRATDDKQQTVTITKNSGEDKADICSYCHSELKKWLNMVEPYTDPDLRYIEQTISELENRAD